MQMPQPEGIFLDSVVSEPDKWVTYESHDAYSTFIQQHSLLDKCIALWRFLKGGSLLAVKWLISYEMIAEQVRSGRTYQDSVDFVKYTMRHALKKIIKQHYTSQCTADFGIHQTLQKDGICVLSLDNHCFHQVMALAQPLFNDLREQRAKTAQKNQQRDFSASRGKAFSTKDNALYQRIENILTDQGIIDACSRYMGYRTKLVDINPQINDETDGFWHKIFTDTSVSVPKTAYFHRDVSGGDLKLILYLSDVAMENGPFSFVVGTHQIRYSSWATWVAKANDQAGLSGCDRYRSSMLFCIAENLAKKSILWKRFTRFVSNFYKTVTIGVENFCATREHGAVRSKGGTPWRDGDEGGENGINLCDWHALCLSLFA